MENFPMCSIVSILVGDMRINLVHNLAPRTMPSTIKTMNVSYFYYLQICLIYFLKCFFLTTITVLILKSLEVTLFHEDLSSSAMHESSTSQSLIACKSPKDFI